MPAPYDKKFWQLSSDAVLHELKSSRSGLAQTEVDVRCERYGPNIIGEQWRRNALKIFLSQFRSGLHYILIIAAIISFFVGNRTDALIILAIVLINAGLGFFQEWRGERAVERLKRMIKFFAKVQRNGGPLEVDVSELVPGDMVYLNIGDRVPADLRLIEADELHTDEAVLTGEPYPVRKGEKAIKADSPALAELANIALLGSTVVSGKGTGVVIGTGHNTYFGQTAKLVEGIETAGEFQKSLGRFGQTLAKIALVVVVIVALLNIVVGHDLFTSVLFGIALAVALVPELLPVILTITLSRGAYALSKKGVIVKRLSAVEELGNVDVLCADKTGTLTEAKITVEDYFALDKKKDPHILEFALVCNSATAGKEIKGNPIDVALLEHARKVNFNMKGIEAWEKVHEVPFDYNRRRMSWAVRKGGKHYLIVKGAPEAIFDACTKVRIAGYDSDISRRRVELNKLNRQLAEDGYRAIAVAIKLVSVKKDYSASDEHGLTFLGFITLSDPPRPEVKQTLDLARKLGVALKIVTGDNAWVTRAIAKQVGLQVSDEQMITGEQLDKITDPKLLRETVERVIIFSRVTSEQKFRIVRSLRGAGHVVAFLGDGVNDAPGLREADVGLSVATGADVAKEVADIVLTHKSLHIVINGIAEGRRVFTNIVKYVIYTMAGNFGELFAIAAVSPFLAFVPLLPTQVLLVNFLSDAPLVAISTDNVDPSELRRPRRWDVRGIVTFGGLLGAIGAVFNLILIYFVINQPEPVVQTALFLDTLLCQMVIVFSIRSRRFMLSAVPPSPMLATAMVGVILLSFLFITPPLSELFKFAPVTRWLIMIVVGLAALYLVVTEAVKLLTYSRIVREKSPLTVK